MRLSVRQTTAAALSPIRVRACTAPMPMRTRVRASPRPIWSLRVRTSSTKTAPSSPRPSCLPATWPSPTSILTAWLRSAVARRRGHARTMRWRPRPLSFRLRACWPKSLFCAMPAISTAFSLARLLCRPTTVIWPSAARLFSICRLLASRLALPIRAPRRPSSAFRAASIPRWRSS